MTNREGLVSMAKKHFRKFLNSMPSEKLAEWISDNLGKKRCDFCFYKNECVISMPVSCTYGIEKWLKSECEENE